MRHKFFTGSQSQAQTRINSSARQSGALDDAPSQGDSSAANDNITTHSIAPSRVWDEASAFRGYDDPGETY